MPSPPSTTELGDLAPRDKAGHVLILGFGAPDREIGRRFLVLEPLAIGRSSDFFAHAPKAMSRQHAEVTRDGTSLSVRDLGSRSGTFVNGEKIQKRVLQTGDVVVAGGLGLVVAWAPLVFVPSDGIGALAAAGPALAFWSVAMERALAEVKTAARSHRPFVVVGEPGVGKRVLAERLAHEAGGRLCLIDGASVEPPKLDEHALTPKDTLLFSRLSEADGAMVRLCVDRLRRRERGEPSPRVVVALGEDADGAPVVPEELAPYFEGNYVRVPPLAERPEDILPIAGLHLQRLAKRKIAIGPVLAMRLLRHRWLGNVRGLCAEIERVWVRAGASAAATDVLDDAETEALRDVCKVARDASFIESAWGERTSLQKRKVLRALLRGLIDARKTGPLDASGLAQLCWPGEKISPLSATNRVYVAVTTLRKLGLGKALAYGEGGYRLLEDETVRVVEG